MNNEIVNAMEELENWLADPTELGRKPAKIEYTASFEDEDGIKCMIFKFKKSFFGKWLLGIVSESGTFMNHIIRLMMKRMVPFMPDTKKWQKKNRDLSKSRLKI